MKYWIVGDEFLDNEAKKEADAQGYLRELVCCKDCKYSVDEYDDGECYCDYEKDLRYIKDWDHYCSWAEGKEK